jgi:hypothetical protein
MRSSFVRSCLLDLVFVVAIGGCSRSNRASGSDGDTAIDATGGIGGIGGIDDIGGIGAGNAGAPAGGVAGLGTGGLIGSGGIAGQPVGGQGGRENAAGAGGQAIGGMPDPGGSGVLYAWDGFGSEPGDIYGVTNSGIACGPNSDPNKCGFFNIGSASGKGWARGWDQGEHSKASYYAFSNTSPMRFSSLATSGNYLLRRQWDLGRVLDLKQAAVAPLVQGEHIAKAGTVVWVSALVRLDATGKNNDMAAITLHRSGLGYHFYGETAWFAAAFPSRGHTNWGLWVAPGNTDPFPGEQGAVVHATNKAATLGVAQLVVVKVEISGGTSDKVSLYVDPPSLGGNEPSTPDAMAMTGQTARFRAFAVAGTSYDNVASAFPVSIDEVRIGTSFAAVTPRQ